MASSEQHGGYDCEFVERPQELQADCPICMVVLREPFQVTCCGNSYCRTCIELVQTNEKACPTCNEPDFSAFLNKGLQRALYSFRVRCVHQKSGCEWTGELRELDRHLNLNPELGKLLNGCDFAPVACTHCREYFQRRHVHPHESECPQRAFSCDHCKHYGSVYEDVVNNHWPVCKCYPVPCPNECGMSPERQNVETHVNTVCPLTVVNCDFHYAGCEVQLVRKDMPTHLAESLATHISLLTTQTQTLADEDGQDNLLPHLSSLVLHNLIQLTSEQKESLEESQCKIREFEREKQAQATANAELRKCSEASRHEVGALKQKVDKDLTQELTRLRGQQNKKRFDSCTSSFVLLLCTCFFVFLFFSWNQASEIERLKWKVNELSRQQVESLEESQYMVQDHERVEQAVNNLRCSEASKHEIGAQKLQDVEQEVAVLKRQLKESLDKTQQKIQALERDRQMSQHRQEIEALKQKLDQDMKGKVAKLKGQLEGRIEKSQRKIQDLEREKQTHKQEMAKLKGTIEKSQHKVQELEKDKQKSKQEIEVLKQKLNKDMEGKVAKLKGQLEGSMEKSQRKIQELEREKQTNKQEIEALKRKVNTGLEQEVAKLGKQQKWQWEEFQRKTQEFERKKQNRKHGFIAAHRGRRHCRS